MDANGLSQTRMAAILNVNKATVSRTLSTASFSAELGRQVTAIVGPSPASQDAGELLRQSLRLCAQSGMLLDAARTLAAQALDLVERKQ